MARFWIQFVMVLGAILLGIRRGGVALGLIGGLGVSLLVLGFRSSPSEPPIAVMQFVMLAFGAFIMFATNVKAKDIAHSSVFIAGMIAVVSIFGIAWMSDTFISANKMISRLIF